MRYKKVIAIVANTTWNIHNFRLNIVRKLLDENYQVVVIAPVDEYIKYRKEFPEVRHIPLRRLERDSINPITDFNLFLELRAIYKKIKPDLVLHYTVKPNIYGGMAAKLLGIETYAVVTGLGYAFIHKGFIKTVTKILYRISNRFHEKVIFENKDDRALFIENKLVKEDRAVAIKGCGVDTSYFSPRENQKNGQSKTIFTFIGRMLYDKGVTEFIEAAQILKTQQPNTEFWLVGEIDKENPSSIRENDFVTWMKEEHIKYHGSTRDVRDYISKSDCIVLPSYREGMPRVIMEALSMEKPVITTDTAGCRETVDEGKNGFLVEVRNSQALAEAMRSFTELPHERRTAMGKAGRQKAILEFDESVIANQFFEILRPIKS